MTAELIQQNLTTVRHEINAACQRCDRDPAAVGLVAVTKYAEWEWVKSLAAFHATFGESRPQQLAERSALMPDANWHLIGRLQRNKVKLAVQHATLIHSVDSLRLLQRIASIAEEMQRRPRVLLQLNISGEESKSGFCVKELAGVWDDVLVCHRHVELAGFMTMAPASDDPEDARDTFCRLAQVKFEYSSLPQTIALGVALPELSMGMSGDFQVAIEEGATLVRIGSRLFQGLQQN